MQDAVDIYPPENITGGYAIAAGLILIGSLLAYVSIKYLLKKKAQHIQKELQTAHKPNLNAIISAALHEIETIKAGLKSGSHHPKNASEEVSKIARQTFDMLMNHRTMYQTKSETSLRRLESIAQLQSIAYPIEFSRHYSVDQAIGLCDKASEVVQSCR